MKTEMPPPWRKQQKFDSSSSVNIQGGVLGWLVPFLLGAVLAIQFWLHSEISEVHLEVKLIRAYLADYDIQDRMRHPLKEETKEIE